ncbi:hypothetical protein GGR56DRAFT_678749 [Xylariaceae sp. FL0804]|nr:hypothetical protein GGR56DRAFT_678749 [Xylariaceae sp. FL0804]
MLYPSPSSDAVLRSARLPSSDYLCLILGTDNATARDVFAFADSHALVVEVDKQWTLPCTTPLDQGQGQQQALVSLNEQVMAQSAAQGICLGDTPVVLDTTPSMAEALA